MERRSLLSKKIGSVVSLMAIWLSFPMFINAQIQVPQQPLKASHWYFGDKAGLDFSQGHPVAVTDGAMQSFEGTASMSDATGNLMFYTNGGSMPYNGGVWNRNHQLMPNGNMANSGGCNSSFQGSLIVNQPRSNDVFYLFTTDCIENSSVGGLRYSVVDMNQDGGLGDVVVKGVQLSGPTDESLTAVQHANGKDWWIVTHRIRTDSFFVYHLNHTGIVGVVKSKVGNVTPTYAGAIKVSTNGEKLVYAGLNWTTVFDFDIFTGQISNPIDLNTQGYSAAFSPMCRYLYVANGINKNIYQFDLYHGSPASTKTLVGATTSLGIGSMELGPDGRIYVARFTSAQHLGVINDPDYAGAACNYVDDGIFLNGKISKGGLPAFPNNYMGGCAGYPEENGSSNGPLNAQLMRVESNSAAISWNNTGNYGYRVIYRELGDIDWREEVVYNTELTLNDLTPETQYEVRVMELATSSDNYEPMYNHFIDEVLAENSNLEVNNISKTLHVVTPGLFEFAMYPNPAAHATRLTVNTGSTATNVNVRVVDLKGMVVREANYTGVEGIQNYNLELNGLNNGIYNILVTANNQSSVQKLVVMQ